jgi:arsenate reductase (glutaredoxin)
MEKITVYEKPTCTTCRKVSKYLIENGVDFEKVNYYIDPLSKEQIKILLKKMNAKPEDVMRKKEAAFKELDLQNKPMTDDDLIEKMVQNPDLLERPIIEIGDKAILARPAEKVHDLFKK